MNKFSLKLKPLYRSIKLFSAYFQTLIKRKKKILLPAAIALFFFVLIVLNFNKIFTQKVTVYEGFVGSYTVDNLPEVVTKLMSTGLVSIDKSGLAKPNLALKWEVNEDATEYTFTLRNDLKWVTGEKVKASDIDLSIADAKIEIINDQTIKFKIKDSFSPFPTFLAKPIFKKNSNNIGIGPYKITKLKKDQIFIKVLTLKSADKKMPNVVLRFYPNEKISKNALKLGEVQAILGVNSTNEFSADKNILSYSKTNTNQLVTIFYNTKDKVLSDENFRLALSYAAPAIPNELEAKTSISPYSWAFNPDVKDYLNNPDAAKTSLAKVENGKDSTITLTTTTNLKNVGEKVVDEWNKQGIKAVLKVESGIPQNFQALLIAHSIPADPDQYSLWHSTQSTNISKFSDPKASPRIDKDLEDGRKITDLEVRKARYFDFQKVLLDRAPATFLYFPKYNVLYRKKIEAPLKNLLELQLP